MYLRVNATADKAPLRISCSVMAHFISIIFRERKQYLTVKTLQEPRENQEYTIRNRRNSQLDLT